MFDYTDRQHGLLNILKSNTASKKQASVKEYNKAYDAEEYVKSFVDNMCKYSESKVREMSVLEEESQQGKDSPNWVEIITHTIEKKRGASYSGSNSIYTFTYQTSVITDIKGGNKLVYCDYEFCDPDCKSPCVTVSINDTCIPSSKEEEAKVIYNKLKEMLIGKGNNYIQISDGTIRALTIPMSSRKRKEKADGSK